VWGVERHTRYFPSYRCLQPLTESSHSRLYHTQEKKKKNYKRLRKEKRRKGKNDSDWPLLGKLVVSRVDAGGR